MPVLIPPDDEPDLTGEELVIDSTTVDASNTPLALENPDGGITVISQDYPPPDRSRVTASSIDTIGDPVAARKVGNRTITVEVRCWGSEAIMRARVSEITRKVGKLAGEPTAADPSITGTLKRTLNNGDEIIFDVLDAQVTVPADWHFLHSTSVTCTIEFTCKPYGRGTETTAATFSEATLPEAVFTVEDVKGDVPALARLVVADDSSSDQWFLHWGLQPPRLYPGTATDTTTAALGYEGEQLTALNTAAATAITGASGGTTLHLSGLTTSYQAILGTDLNGTALSHVGTYRVWVRTYCYPADGSVDGSLNGTVDMRLEWRPSAAGAYTANDAISIVPEEGSQFLYRDLGLVSIPKVTSGAQQWDGRIVARSDGASDGAGVDRVMLVPVDAGYGEARIVQSSAETPAEYVARDDFSDGTATLAGSALDIGGTWSVAGTGGTFTLDGGSVTTSGTTSASFALAGTAQYGNVAVSAYVDAGTVFAGPRGGLVARYAGTGDYIAFRNGNTGLYAFKTVGGTASSLGYGASFAGGQAGTLTLAVDATGRWSATDGTETLSGQDDDLATGGALASGTVGLYRVATSAGTVYYDDFLAWEPAADAVIFADQTIEVSDHSATHDNDDATAVAPVADYTGDYLRLPPEGMEEGTARFFVRACRNLPDTMNDPAIDDISGTVYYTPLYWQIPE